MKVWGDKDQNIDVKFPREKYQKISDLVRDEKDRLGKVRKIFGLVVEGYKKGEISSDEMSTILGYLEGEMISDGLEDDELLEALHAGGELVFYARRSKKEFDRFITDVMNYYERVCQ